MSHNIEPITQYCRRCGKSDLQLRLYPSRGCLPGERIDVRLASFGFEKLS